MRVDVRCPDCGAALAGGGAREPEVEARCPECALPLRGAAAHELWWVDGALAGLRIQETRLLARREELLGVLREARARGVGESAGPIGERVARRSAGAVAQGTGGVPPGAVDRGAGGAAQGAMGPPPGAGGREGAGAGARPREVSAGAVQNLLLILGGLLLTVAAVVFTVVSWGRMGIGGRAAVLAGFTALAMVAPAVLVRRRLTATAETVAGLAIALLLLDGYAARRVGFLGVDTIEGLDYTAMVCALIALILVAYARVVPLRGPAPVAVVLAQPVLPLMAGDSSLTWIVAMLVATVALNVALVLAGRPGTWPWARITAVVCGCAVVTLALLAGVPNALDTDYAGQALGRSVPLVALVLLGAYVAGSLARPGGEQRETWAAMVTAATVLTLIIVLAAPAQAALGGLSLDWRPTAYLVPAVVVALAATWLPWRRVRLAGMYTGALVALPAALTLLPRLVATLAAPLPWLDTLWTGTWDGGPLPGEVTTPVDVVMLGVLAAGFLVPAVRRTGGWPVETAVAGALVSGTLMVAVAPATFAMAYPATMAVLVALTAGLAAAATLGRTPWWAAATAFVATLVSVEAAAYAFGSRTATLIVLPILAVPAAAVALAGRVTALRVWGLGGAVLFLGVEAMAAGLAAGLSVKVAASVGCAVAGVLLLGTSLWPRRDGVRPEWLRYAGTALLLMASWLRLWADEVTVVEAYTVPFSLVLLGFGWWRRRSADLSSWVAYGAGLSATMLPSLVAVYADTEWRRSAALGVAALAVLLAGARFRLQAPALIGGVVLAGVVMRELAPYVSEILLAVPRWVPIALGGLLLVVVGATYEARMRDLRRLRDTLAKMR